LEEVNSEARIDKTLQEIKRIQYWGDPYNVSRNALSQQCLD